MVRNLLDNAQRHGHGAIELDVRADADQAVVTICDEGPGVADSERERIFLPFHRTPGSKAATGTGLGLTLVRQIARQHGGDAVWAGASGRPSGIRVVIPRRSLTS
jgi:signal transduction histidine kinase